jgi:hypothetical protein
VYCCCLLLLLVQVSPSEVAGFKGLEHDRTSLLAGDNHRSGAVLYLHAAAVRQYMLGARWYAIVTVQQMALCTAPVSR